MPAGMILLLLVAALVYFGVVQRILDRMRLTDTQALLFIGLMIAGSFVNIPLLQGRTEISINVGGALVPLALAIYLLTKADTTREWVRAIIAAVVTAGVVFGISQITDFEPPRRDIIDPVWLFGIVAGIVGYLAGRSRRASFIAGTLGIIITDIVHMVRAFTVNLPTTVAIGGAGIFDTVVLAGIIAVSLAEIVGETRERIQGGPAYHEGEDALKSREFLGENTGEKSSDDHGEKLTGENTGPADGQLSDKERDQLNDENPGGKEEKG